MAKRKETNASLDEFGKEFIELCRKYHLLSSVCITATKMEAADDAATIGMGICVAGSGLMHESLCAYGFGYTSGHHVQTMDGMKALGRAQYDKS